MSARLDLKTHAGEFELMGFQRDHLLPVEPLLDRHRVELRAPLVFCFRELSGHIVFAEQLLELCDRALQIGGVFGRYRGVEGGMRIDQRPMTAVEDEPTHRGQALNPDAIAVGQLRHIMMLDDLQIVETNRRCAQNHHDQRGEPRNAWFELWNRPALVLTAKFRHFRLPG